MSKNKKPCIFISAGGTGGHIFPALAVAEIFKNRYKILFFTDIRGINFILNKKNTYQIHKIPSANLDGNLPKKVLALWKIFFGILISYYYMIKYSPILTLGFGGYSTVPVLGASVLNNTPIILHEQNSVMGVVNRFFAKFAKLIMLGFPKTRNINPQWKSKTIFLGNPIRESFNNISLNAKDFVDDKMLMRSKKIKIFIVGGSQGSKLFNKIASFISSFPKNIKEKLMIVHQVRKEDLNEIENIYNKNGIQNYTIKPFFNDIEYEMSKANLIISRGGALSISEIEHCKKPAIMIPLKIAKDNHQYYNALHLQEKGSAIIIEESEFINSEEDEKTSAYKKILNILSSENILKEMHKKAILNNQFNKSSSKIAIKINQYIIDNIKTI